MNTITARLRSFSVSWSWSEEVLGDDSEQKSHFTGVLGQTHQFGAGTTRYAAAPNYHHGALKLELTAHF